MPEIEAKQEKPEYIEQIADVSAGQLERDERVLVRKIDLYLLPTIWMMYLWSYMDRTKYVSPYYLYAASVTRRAVG